MDLKEFTKQTIKQIVEGVDEISSELIRGVRISYKDSNRSIEFDVAVSVSENTGSSGKVEAAGHIKVVPFLGGVAKGEGEINKEILNSTVTRIRFGVDVSTLSKAEEHENNIILAGQNRWDPYE